MAPPSIDGRPTAMRRLRFQATRSRLKSSNDRTLNHSTTKIVRLPPRRYSSLHQSRRAEEPFSYTSLKRQPLIRLLKLDRRVMTDNRSSGFILTTVKLSEAPEFYALSYCWGSSERDREIVCNGKLLSVTAHLRRSIQELQAIPALVDSWVWIDQISINQDDPDERSHQVSLMRDIYVRAIRTVVWLGPSDGPSEGGYSLSEKLFKLCQSNKYSVATLGWKMRLPKRHLKEELEEGLGLSLPRMNSMPWIELDRMLRKAWFSRIWVIQEVDLSGETPMLVYGGRARDFSPPMLAGRWIGGSKLRSLRSEPQDPILGPQPLSTYCLDDLYMILNSNYRWTLEALLLHTLDHDATDPRDHIFALLGIATETSSKLHPWPEPLRPDYRSPPWIIFKRATVFLIEQTGQLTPLLLIESTRRLISTPSRKAEFPSWVPDYGSKPTLPCPMGVRLGSSRSVEVTIPWRASGGVRTLPQDLVKKDTLLLDGFEVDQVIWTSADIIGEKNESLLFQWLEGAAGAVLWSFDSFDSSTDYNSVVRDFLDSFLRTVSAVYKDGSQKPQSSDLLEYLDLHESIERPREGYFQKLRPHIVASVIRGADPTNTCKVSDMVAFFCSHTWSIFLTRGGQFGMDRSCGLGGDMVTVLRGGAMPFILRQYAPGGKFRLLGACVILKWMNGLVIDLWKQNKLESRSFEII